MPQLLTVYSSSVMCVTIARFGTAMLSAIALAISVVAPSAEGNTIPEPDIMPAILRDLTYNAPHLSIYLDGDLPNPAISNLERAGILKLVGKTSGNALVPGRLVLLLTERGQRIALSRGWSMARGELGISTGRRAYVRGSYAVRSSNAKEIVVSYSWRYEPNENARYLLSIAPAGTWPKATGAGLASKP